MRSFRDGRPSWIEKNLGNYRNKCPEKSFVNGKRAMLRHPSLIILVAGKVAMAHFSSQTIETLIDLVEIKLSYLDVTDREDRLELKRLQHALVELGAVQSDSGRKQPAPAAVLHH